MKLKIKFTIKHIFRYIYIVLILANFVALYFAFNFTKKYVYQAIVLDQNELIQASRGAGPMR